MSTQIIKEENGFRYLEAGEGHPLLFLHGLFGSLSNWSNITNTFSSKYKVLVPLLPIYDLNYKDADLEGMTAFLESFVKFKGLDKFTLVGNSLGGHIGLIYVLRHQEKVSNMVLTGSSGLFENGMGGSYPKRGDYEFVRERVGYTFYDPNIATDELVSEVFEVTKNNAQCLRMIKIARSAQRHNMANDIPNIKIPVLLIWGLNDTITPPIVAHEFERLLPNAELHFIDKCGHAPMMEHPELFNQYFSDFLEKHAPQAQYTF
jgi:pimeloyl-ACP methyl ester carboxylesterase